MRNKKCVLGHRFFTGYRQHELYACLAPRLSEESKTKLLEVSRAFAEGRTTLDEYVSSLKTLVGIRGLVEAVGIGKGKGDLTTFILDSSKNNQMLSNRPEIPSGKACSSLTCAEIVKYLTGGFRLSKARSNDLFWEAVWPRLLANSEQPRGDGYASTKNCLVFLMHGIKKFSRRKLSKGDHYFDSVSDVLAKVASDPELIELETDEIKPRKPSLSCIDNVPILQIDMVWCYFMLREIFNLLALAGKRLLKARVGIERSHGKNASRVRELQSIRSPEIALYLRLELLEGVATFHSGKLDKSTEALTSAKARYSKLQVSDETLSLLMSMGYHEYEAKRALKMNEQDAESAINFIKEEREKKAKKREDDIKRQKKLVYTTVGGLVVATQSISGVKERYQIKERKERTWRHELRGYVWWIQ